MGLIRRERRDYTLGPVATHNTHSSDPGPCPRRCACAMMPNGRASVLIALALLLSRVNIRHCISGSGHLGLRVNSRSPEILPLALLQPGLVGGGVLKRGCSPPPRSRFRAKERRSCQGSSRPPCPPLQGPLHCHRSAGERTSCHSRGAVSPCPGAGPLVGRWAGCRFGRRGMRREGHGSGGPVAKKTFFIFRMTELWEMGKGLCKGRPR